MTRPSRRPEEGFGDLLRRLRRKRAARLNEETRPVDVARALDVTPAAYTNWEMGIRKPRNIGVYIRLAAYFGVKLSDLGVDVAEMRPEQDRQPDPRAKDQRRVVLPPTEPITPMSVPGRPGKGKRRA